MPEGTSTRRITHCGCLRRADYGGDGLLALLFGYRIFKLLLPLLGFFVGLIVGAQVVASIFGEGFLASVIGIVAGLVVGLLFGALAYVWWWPGVILVFAGMGYALGVSILPALGLDLDFVSVLIGLAVAAVFALGAIVLRMPKLIVIAVTALWGSGATIGELADPHQQDRARPAGLRRRQRGRGPVDLLADRLLCGGRGGHGRAARHHTGIRADVGRGVSMGEPRHPHHPERAQHTLRLRVHPRVRNRRRLLRRSQAPHHQRT